MKKIILSIAMLFAISTLALGAVQTKVLAPGEELTFQIGPSQVLRILNFVHDNALGYVKVNQGAGEMTVLQSISSENLTVARVLEVSGARMGTTTTVSVPANGNGFMFISYSIERNR